MRKGFAMLLLLLLGVFPVGAGASEDISQYISDADKVGQGRLTYLVWDVYDAALYAENAKWRGVPPYAIRLSYLMDIEGRKIAKRSVEEMRGQNLANEVQLATWYVQMKNIFPDVKEGTVVTGVHTADGSSVFYKDGAIIGRIEDADFSEAFFGIWLNPKTSSPDLRRKLIGDQQIAKSNLLAQGHVNE